MVNFPNWKRIPFSDLCSEESYGDVLAAKASIIASNRQDYILPLLLMKEVVGSEGIDLLARLLELDPQKRISARAALLHPFLNDTVEDIGGNTTLKKRQEERLMASVAPLSGKI